MSIQRLERWQDELAMKKKYFSQRKGWARRFAEEANLVNPGNSATGMFYNRQYTVEIGPRGGLNISGTLPWQDFPDGWRWFEKTPRQRKMG